MPFEDSIFPGSGQGACGNSGGSNEGAVKVKIRSNKRQSLTKTLQKLDSDFPCDVDQINFYISKLSKLEADILKLDSDIEQFMISTGAWDDAEQSVQYNICEEYQDKLNLAVIRLNRALSPVNADSQPVPQNAGDQSNSLPSVRPKLKLPNIELPKFDGNPENYSKFITDLESIFVKFDLAQFEKFSYLRDHVSGAAKDILDSIPVGDYNYIDAKKLLHDAFADKTTQQFSVIHKLIRMKSLSNSNLYSWISEARVLSEQINRLEISGEVFAQYFIWNSLSDFHKQQFISLTNKTKPNLKEIIDNSFEIINRISDSYSNTAKSFVLATNVNYNKKTEATPRLNTKICWLCQSTSSHEFIDHKIYNCPKFPTAKEKLAKIKEMGGCSRCGFFNHKVNDCKYKFSGKCRNCDKYHAYFLCVSKGAKSKPASTTVSDISTDIVNSSVITYSVNNISNCSHNVVPTLTARFSNGTNSVSARILYDPASQHNFISQSIVNKISSKTIRKDLEMNIGGFNGVRKYVTREVEICTDIAGKPLKFRAVVVPEIKATVSNPKFPKIVKLFKSNKICLADENLGVTNTIDILLGCNGSATFSVVSTPVGTLSSTQVYRTRAGLMLAGDMSPLLAKSNLKKLKSFMHENPNIE